MSTGYGTRTSAMSREPRATAHPGRERHGRRQDPPQWDEWTDRMKTRHGNGNGHGASLAIEAQRLVAE